MREWKNSILIFGGKSIWTCKNKFHFNFSMAKIKIFNLRPWKFIWNRNGTTNGLIHLHHVMFTHQMQLSNAYKHFPSQNNSIFKTQLCRKKKKIPMMITKKIGISCTLVWGVISYQNCPPSSATLASTSEDLKKPKIIYILLKFQINILLIFQINNLKHISWVPFC